MPRRRHFGNVRKLPSGRWQARYKTDDGRTHRAPATFLTRGEAERWLAATQTDLARGDDVTEARPDQRFGVYARWWLTHRPSLKTSTTELYDWLLTKYVLPDLEAVWLSKVTPALIRQWHAEVSARAPVTPTRQAYSLVRAIFSTAVTDGLLKTNPCTVAGAGNSGAPVRRIPSLDEVEAVAAAVPTRYAALVLTAAWTGARWGELTALSRDRLDLDSGVMCIDRQFVQLRGSKLLEDTPKSEAGVRTVHLPPHLIPLLRGHLDAHVPAGCDLVFPNSLGRPVSRNSFRSVWVLAREKAGQPSLRFHDLRHFGNTLAAATGASTRELMARMGHSTLQAALIYQHATADRDRAIAEALSAFAQRHLQAATSEHAD